MFGVTDLWLFAVSALALIMIPGPDSLYIAGCSASRGFRAGSIAWLGIGMGTLVHIIAAAFGFSAILATSATAFTVVKTIGAAYLVYLGVTMLIAKGSQEAGSIKHDNTQPLTKIFYRGLLTNILNPKVALFFLAFVPQFVAADAPSKVYTFIFLGLVFNFIGLIWCLCLAWTSATVGSKLKQNKRVTKYLTRATGGLFLYFGAKLALSRQN